MREPAALTPEEDISSSPPSDDGVLRALVHGALGPVSLVVTVHERVSDGTWRRATLPRSFHWQLQRQFWTLQDMYWRDGEE